MKFLCRKITLKGVSLPRHESDRLLAFSSRNPIQGSLYNKENILFTRKISLEVQRLQGWLTQCHQQEPMSFLLAACPSSANQPLPITKWLPQFQLSLTDVPVPDGKKQAVSSLCLFLRAWQPRGDLRTFYPSAPLPSRARRMCSRSE